LDIGSAALLLFCRMRAGLKPASYMPLDATLKRRSSTLLHAFTEKQNLDQVCLEHLLRSNGTALLRSALWLVGWFVGTEVCA
jgi:hypothetical protein